MDRLIEEIRAALRANMFILGLQGTLALVDICAALSSDDGRTRGTRFKAWFAENLGHRYHLLSAEDVYQLRCGMLHQGRTASDQYDAIMFTLPVSGGNYWHNIVANNALNLDLVTFCEDIIGAAELWWAANQAVEPVRTNSEDLVRLRLDGLAPYMVGRPVLA